MTPPSLDAQLQEQIEELQRLFQLSGRQVQCAIANIARTLIPALLTQVEAASALTKTWRRSARNAELFTRSERDMFDGLAEELEDALAAPATPGEEA